MIFYNREVKESSSIVNVFPASMPIQYFVTHQTSECLIFPSQASSIIAMLLYSRSDLAQQNISSILKCFCSYIVVAPLILFFRKVRA